MFHADIHQCQKSTVLCCTSASKTGPGTKSLQSLKSDLKNLKACLTVEKIKGFLDFEGMGWSGKHKPRGQFVRTLSALSRILAGSSRPAGGSQLLEKKELEEASWRMPCTALLRRFHGGFSPLSQELLLSHGSFTLGPRLSCTTAVFTPGQYLPMGALALPRGLNSPAEPQACLATLGIAAARCCCCKGIELAGIAEDDIPGSLGIPLPAQPLPSKKEWLPKIMNPVVHTWWHPPPARLRKGWGAEPAPQLEMVE